jgi:hypothetical protein
MYMAAGQIARAFVAATAARVGVGVGQLPGPDGTVNVAAIEAEYSLPELIPVSLIMREMQKRNIAPIVHLWDLGNAEPELAIVFSIPSPERKLLEDISLSTPALGELMHRAGCDELFTTAEANIPRESSVLPFLNEFERRKLAVLLVHETAVDGQYDPDSVFKFVVTDIVRDMPEAFKFFDV